MVVRPRSAALMLGLLALSACSSAKSVAPNEYNDPQYRGQSGGTIFGESGLVFGTAKPGADANNQAGAALGVNAYLWRGALDTLSFMPLASADPFGGVIITDWYEPPSSPGERFKATAYILGRQLRADGIRVAIFRQVQGANGQWTDAQVNATTTGDIENKILARARELRAQAAALSH